MKFVINKSLYDEIEKSVTKKYIKREGSPGHYRYWYKNPDGSITIRGKDENGNKAKNKVSFASHSVGDNVLFKTPEGRIFNGTIAHVKDNEIVINGNGKVSGIQYRVPKEAVKTLSKGKDSDLIKNLYNASTVSTNFRDGTKGLQPEECDNLDGLLKMAGDVREEFSKKSDEVLKMFEGSFFIALAKRSSLKRAERIKEKLRDDEKEYKQDMMDSGKEYTPMCYDEKTDTYHCRTIRDTDGHTFYMNNIKDLSVMFEYFKNDKSIIRIKNNFATPSPVGYSDINMNIRLSNGTVAEIQLNTTANLVAKERYGHALYEVYRSIASNPKYKALADIMGNAQKKLYGKANEYSKAGNFPKVPNNDIYAKDYKHQVYADLIKEDVTNALPLFYAAKKDGVLNKDSIEHFEHLVEYIR